MTESLHCYNSSLYVEHLKASLGIPAGNSGHHENVIAVNLELTWQYPLSEFRAKNESSLCKSVSLFTMGFYVNLYDYIIHVALIATSRARITKY